jgi:hypothetical protein
VATNEGLEVWKVRAHCLKLSIEIRCTRNDLQRHEDLLDQKTNHGKTNEKQKRRGFWKRGQVNSPLVSQNKYNVLLIKDMENESVIADDKDDSEMDCYSITSNKVNIASHNERGPDESQLSAWNACLIPFTPPVVGNLNHIKTLAILGKGKRYFIRTVNMEREICINVMITTLDTHASLMIQVLLDSGATGLFLNKKFIHKNGLKARL